MGIVGAVASRNITPILVEGLKRLEYRGYDSCGVAVHADGALEAGRSVSHWFSWRASAETVRASPASPTPAGLPTAPRTVVNAHPHFGTATRRASRWCTTASSKPRRARRTEGVAMPPVRPTPR